MVREIFQMAKTEKACFVLIYEVDAVGGARFDDGHGGDKGLVPYRVLIF